MLPPGLDSECCQAMDLFNEIDDLNDLFSTERNSKLDSAIEEQEDLQSKYSSLHENYAKEIENSKKVEKCLVKCLKFYSKLCKKYEIQQNVIKNLEESIKEKINILDEMQKNEERMKGLVQVYRTERTLYAGQTNSQLRKDKELLLDICCKLISDSVKNNNTKNLTHLLLRKFKNDLDDEKINMLKGKSIKLKDDLDFIGFEVSNPGSVNLQNERQLKPEEKYNNELTKIEVKEFEEYTKNDPLDLSLSKTIAEKSDCLKNEHSNQINEKELFLKVEQSASCVASSLPSLEVQMTIELNEKQCQSETLINFSNQESNLFPSENSNFESEHIITNFESINESTVSEKHCALTTTAIEKESPILIDQAQLAEKQCSIFDVSDPCITVNNCRTEIKRQESVTIESEGFPDIFFESEDNLEHTGNVKSNAEFSTFEEESMFPYEKELFKIFREMSSVKLLSPIRELTDSSFNLKTCNNGECEKSGSKRNSNPDENSSKSKKLKLKEEKANCNLLDSIMSAMSIQNEEFKGTGVVTKRVNIETAKEVSSKSCSPVTRNCTIVSSKENSSTFPQCLRKRESKERVTEKLVIEEIKNFVTSEISSKEEAEISVRHCLSVLSNKSEDLIAKCIVAIIFENVDETVEIFERPSPPLTKTQHRLIVLLSVFKSLELNFQIISNKILSLISEKLLPDNFFWPDDCVEAATRFYAALCRARNDTKALWKFCLQGMIDMRQRCPLLMLTALKTWPDVLHDASTLKNNVLAVTIVNIFLHMPKKEGLRNFNQSQKLVALKHLLLNFYQFKVEDTIEGYTKKLLDSVLRKELGSEKSIVLLSKCRNSSWTVKNILPLLKSKLVDFVEGNIEDSAANRILSVMRKICPALQDDKVRAELNDIVFFLSKMLTSAKTTHDCEVLIIEILLQFKQYPEVRKVIREWIPKNPIDDSLRNEIINASAVNILRELKLNRRKEPKRLNTKKKLKKQLKKSKKKKLKRKKLKKNESKSKAQSSDGVGF